MKLNCLNICQIFVDSDEDFDNLIKAFGSDAVLVSKGEPNFNSDIPTLILGWNRIEKYFPDQKIAKRKIKDNLSWSFSSAENKDYFKKETKQFVENCIDEFLDAPFISYDAIIDGKFNDFVKNNIQTNIKYYVYFHNNACYLYGGRKIIVIGLESIKFIGKDTVELMTTILNSINCIIFDYNNLNGYVNFNKLKKIISIENIYWTKLVEKINYYDLQKLFKERDIKSYMSYLMSLLDIYELNEEEHNSCLRQVERDIITIWLSGREIFFDMNFKPDKSVRIKWHNYKKYTKTRYSNKQGITGRIYSNVGFNPQTLPKNSEIRQHMVSRYDGGKIVVFDYVSFESKLSLYFSKNKEFIEKYKNSDLHLETAKVIYENENLSNEQRAVGKNVNHAIQYGGGDDTIMSLMIGVKDKKEVICRLKKFLKPILDVAEYTITLYKELGYLKTNFGTLIKPDKEYAAYNNYISLTASEIVVNKLYEIRDFLKGKKSKFIFQLYDSFVFDFHPDELKMIDEIKDMLSVFKDFSFMVECKIGNNYAEC